MCLRWASLLAFSSWKVVRRKNAFLGLILGRFQDNFLLGAFCAEICQFGMLPRALIHVAEEESPRVEELLSSSRA